MNREINNNIKIHQILAYKQNTVNGVLQEGRMKHSMPCQRRQHVEPDLPTHKLEVEDQQDEKNEKDTDGAKNEALLVHPSRCARLHKRKKKRI